MTVSKRPAGNVFEGAMSVIESHPEDSAEYYMALQFIWMSFGRPERYLLEALNDPSKAAMLKLGSLPATVKTMVGLKLMESAGEGKYAITELGKKVLKRGKIDLSSHMNWYIARQAEKTREKIEEGLHRSR